MRSVTIAAMAVSGILVILASDGLGRRQPEPRASSVENADGAATVALQLESMAIQVIDLVRRVERLEADRLTAREPLLPDPPAAVTQPDGALVALAERVSLLEQRAMANEPQLAGPEGAGRSTPSQEREIQDRIGADHETIRDPSVSDSDKANAWLDLAGREVYPWTDDVVAEMISIGLTSTDDRAREVVWIGAESRFRNDLLVQPLISALADPVANVREEAADALSQYLDMPGVRNALTWTSSYDASEEVRNEALKALREEE